MKAAIRRKYGPPEVLRVETLDRPVPKDHEILVKVHAATVNRTDCANLQAKPFVMRFTIGLFKPRQPVTGTDFAGEVEAVGSKVNRFKAGDRVFGFDDAGLGSHAGYLTLPEDQAIGLIPEGMSFEQAAAGIEGAHYAINFLNKVTVREGDLVMVNGGSGAIGSALLQLAKAQGARVSTTCRKEHIERIVNLGAEEAIDYTREDFTRSGKHYDFVFDAVGKSTFGKCKPILKPGGTYISSELGPGGQNLFFTLTTRFSGGKKVVFPFPTGRQASIDLVRNRFEEGKYTPLIDRTYALEDIADAFRYVLSGQKVGNVVIRLNGWD